MNTFGATPVVHDPTAETQQRSDEYNRQLDQTRARMDAERENERARVATALATELAAARAIGAEQKPAATNPADIAAEIKALITNERRIAMRGQSLAVDLAALRQEIDLIAKWIVAVNDDGR
jgi:hypothetical protein